MNKNAYEIRLEVLRMAHADAFTRYHESLNAHRVNADKGNIAHDVQLSDALFPRVDDILQRADALYAFVEGK